MGGCKEEDFLEKLGPQLRRKIRAERKACPDAETLSAVLEGTAPGPVREQVMEHLRHCAECAALQTRLQAFDDVTMPESAAEWSQQQIRLDNWLEGFLRSERASRAKREGKSLWEFLTWETVSKYLMSRKLQWALGATAALLLIIGSVLLVRLRHPQLPQNQAALRGAMPQPQPVSPPTGKPAEARPGKPPVGERPKATGSQEQRAVAPNSSQEQTTPSPPQDHNLPTLTAEARQAPPPRPEAGEPPKSASVYAPYSRYSGGPKAFTPSGRAVARPTMGMLRSGITARVVSPNGQEASLGPGGRITEIHDGIRGMTIECGLHPADRRIVTGRNGRTVVSTGPTGGYLQRPFYRDRYGRSYVQRTYWVNGHPYAYAYRDHFYHGLHYYCYVPRYYYHPVFYGWAYNPWAAPVYYTWGWGPAAPWFYGGYFAPAPYYPTASWWLTDYLLAENLKLAYENEQAVHANPEPRQAGHEPPPQASGAAGSPMSPQVKAMVEAEVHRQLQAEQAAVQSSQTQTAEDQAPPPAVDPAERVFVVSMNLGVSTAEGQECELTPGDVITRIDDIPGDDSKVRASVTSSKPNDCAVGLLPRVAVTDLQEMNNTFRQQLDAGLDALAKNAGTGGLPKAPATQTSLGEVPLPTPDANLENMLQDQWNEAMQLEAEVQQQVKNGQGRNELATTPAAVPPVQGAGNKAAAASQSPSIGAKNANVLRVPHGGAVRSQPSTRQSAPMRTGRPVPSPQKSKPAVPPPPHPHP